MKKFMILVVMAVAAITASAQKGEYFVTPHLNVGYGYMSNMAPDMDIPAMKALGFADIDFKDNKLIGVGADFEYMLADQFGISAGIDVNYMKSSTYSVKVGSNGMDADIDYGWLNIPILAQYHFGQFAVKAGIQPTYFLDGTGTIKVNIGGHKETLDYSMTDDANRLGLAIPLGISYTFKAPVTLDLRCALPVTSVADNGPAGKSAKLTTVSLSVGYRF